MEKNALHIWQVRQDADTPVSSTSGLFSVRFASARARESRQSGDAGQDYLTAGEREQSFAFAVCDGVSLSFFGEQAAAYVGDALLRWLFSVEAEDDSGEAELAGRLHRYLTACVPEASRLIEQLPLPDHIDGLFREVLEEKRLKGSEATFVCGRVDLPGPAYPQGRLLLAWMGDTRLRLWSRDGECSRLLGERFHTGERWSTLHGPVGAAPHLFVAGLHDGKAPLYRLAAYTDGLAILDDWSELPADDRLQGLIEEAGGAAASDDIAYLELGWEQQPGSRVREQSLYAEMPLRSRMDERRSKKTGLMKLWNKLF